MSDEEQQRRSRVVVETPTARREETYTRTTRAPERSGYSTGVIAAVALTAIALTALVLFFLMNNRDDATNTNVRIATTAPTPLPTVPTPLVVQQPVQQAPPQPIIVQQPPATTQPAPVIVTPPASSSGSTSSSVTVNTNPVDDATIESRVNKVLTDDSTLTDAGITVTVINGKATLIGTVKSQDLKTRAERLARGVKGVKNIDNKLIVENTTP